MMSTANSLKEGKLSPFLRKLNGDREAFFQWRLAVPEVVHKIPR